VKIFKLSQEQMGFEFNEPEETPEDAKESDEIQFLGPVSVMNAHFVHFRMGNRFYIYRMPFEDWTREIANTAKYRPGQALNDAKSKSLDEYEVTNEFPAQGSILRKI